MAQVIGGPWQAIDDLGVSGSERSKRSGVSMRATRMPPCGPIRLASPSTTLSGIDGPDMLVNLKGGKRNDNHPIE